MIHTNTPSTAAPSLKTIRHPVQTDLTTLDRFIKQALHSQVALINDITAHIIDCGGKRLRPLITLLSARACGYSAEAEHIELAAIIEFIHTATLLHDDVIDGSSLRRNQPTAHEVWDSTAAVLAGDFLYSRAFQILARRKNIPIMTLLANTTNAIAEAEVAQMTFRLNVSISEADYYSIIDGKTAQLYQAASHIGAMIAPNSQTTIAANLAQFGYHLGMAFQMVDDAIDYTGDPDTCGKNMGDDLAEGKLTLPLIYALEKSPPAQIQLLKTAITQQKTDDMPSLLDAVKNSGGIEYTITKAEQFAENAYSALQILEDSAYKNALEQLCKFVIRRKY